MTSCPYELVPDRFRTLRAADFIYELVKLHQKTPTEATASEVVKLFNYETGSKIDSSQALSALNEPHWVPFLAKLFDHSCPAQKISMPANATLVELRSMQYKNQLDAMNAFRNFINTKLDEDMALPVGVAFCRSVLTDHEIEGVSMVGVLDSSTCPGEIHFAIVAGRRLLHYIDKETKKEETICQYLIRDSYGKSCSAYSDIEVGGVSTTGLPPKVCENGHVWIDENALLRNTAEALQLR